MHSFLRCRGCGLAYVAELPSAADLRASYERVHLSDYQVSHKQDWAPFLAHKRATLEALGVAPPAGERRPPALDIGCGEGVLMGLLDQLGWEPWGLELNPVQAGQAAARGYPVAVASADDPAPLPPGAPPFELVLMNHLVEHLRHPAAVLGAAYQWMRPGGRLVLETPQRPDFDNIDHLYCFSAASLEQLLRGCGFSPLRWYDYVDDNYGHHNLACLASR